METYGVALVPSTQEAMQAETLAKGEGLQVRIIPTPEKIFASCGFSLKYSLDEEQLLWKLLKAHDVTYGKFYHARRQGLAVTYELAEDIR